MPTSSHPDASAIAALARVILLEERVTRWECATETQHRWAEGQASSIVDMVQRAGLVVMLPPGVPVPDQAGGGGADRSAPPVVAPPASHPADAGMIEALARRIAANDRDACWDDLAEHVRRVDRQEAEWLILTAREAGFTLMPIGTDTPTPSGAVDMQFWPLAAMTSVMLHRASLAPGVAPDVLLIYSDALREQRDVMLAAGDPDRAEEYACELRRVDAALEQMSGQGFVPAIGGDGGPVGLGLALVSAAMMGGGIAWTTAAVLR